MTASIICGIDDSAHVRAAARLTFAVAVRERAAMVVPGTRAYWPLCPVLFCSVLRGLACRGSRLLGQCSAHARRED